MSITLCNSGHVPVAFADTDACPVCAKSSHPIWTLTTHQLLIKVYNMIEGQSAAQAQLDEARMQVELMENTIADLNQRIAVLES